VPAIPKSILALDVGDRRIGLAVATLAARLPRPLTTLIYDDNFFSALAEVITAENVGTIVLGFPRDLNGQPTAQTAATERFAEALRQHIKLPLQFQDESVTSKQAEAELEARGKPYQKADIDALAATYILEDFLAEHRELVA
jgi:putative holliday junction resolvase